MNQKAKVLFRVYINNTPPMRTWFVRSVIVHYQKKIFLSFHHFCYIKKLIHLVRWKNTNKIILLLLLASSLSPLSIFFSTKFFLLLRN